jgi:hypothetical protein
MIVILDELESDKDNENEFTKQLRQASKFLEHKDLKGCAAMMQAAAYEIDRLNKIIKENIK